MTNKVISFCLFIFTIAFNSFAQTGISDNFNENVLAAGWKANSQFALNDAGGVLQITAGASAYQTFEFQFTPINLTTNSVLTVEIKSAAALTVRMDLGDVNGKYTNATPTSVNVTAGATFTTYTFNFTGKTSGIDITQVSNVAIFFNPGGSFNGTVYFDNFALGTGGPTNGGGGGIAGMLNTKLRLSQIGFYPICQKLGVAVGAPAGPFYITTTDLQDTVFRSTLSPSATWSYSGETVRIADFSALNATGTFMLVVPSMGRSYPFNIANNVHFGVHVSSLRGFYYVRCSEAITAANGGTWARAAGHITQDGAVQVNSDAATTIRPKGTLLSCERGWYDAGDYNKYAVNAGISTYTLMALYEHYPNYYDTLNLNIPESTNSIPDLLDQVIWELRWFFTQQDPNDGGVYHKTTNQNFDPLNTMPAAATSTRYVVAKSTAATFDFAAVMAMASRLLRQYNTTLLPGLADSCLNAANSAWIWGRKNPNITFLANPGGFSTGIYNDAQLTDEQEWAAMELYITTKLDSFYTATNFLTERYWVPEWDTVRTLGLISMVQNRKNLTPIADTTAINNLLLTAANTLSATAASSAYRVAMGATAGYPGDFVWGSNGQAGNQGLILIQAYRLTGNINYWDAAIDNLDYINGRNATTYCFLTGSGSNSPMNIQHRPSIADGIVAPVPGLTSGGPQNYNNPDGVSYPTPSYPAVQYVDNVNSYSTNEVAINWNAPYAYLSGAAEVLNPCGGLTSAPVQLMNFSVAKKNAQVLLNWQTATELNNNYFEIQRSSNSKTFTAIGRLNGNGNSTEILNYNFDDNNPLEGISYYRLKQVDYNGNYNYSQALPVSFTSVAVSIYPNPATDDILIKCQEELLGITLQDVTGRTVFKQNFVNGESIQQVSLSTLQEGLYLVSVQTKTQTVVQKLILQ